MINLAPLPPPAARAPIGTTAPTIPTTGARKIRILVVDDSVVIRRFLTRVIGEDPAFDMIGYAADGRAALVQAAELKPDAITMDIEMPQMDGLAAVRELRAQGSKAVIIMCSTLTSRGAASTIEALIGGANDYVTKPSNSNSMDAAFEALRLELLPKIKQFFAPARWTASSQPAHPAVPAKSLQSPSLVPPATHPPASPALAATPFAPFSRPPAASHKPHFASVLPVEQRKVVAIGVSTGGPTALMRILPALPADFPLPILIVQHMPPIFTSQLADRLRAESKLEVVEASEGMALKAGRVIIAAGDYHMRLKRVDAQMTVTLDQGERENSCRPAVDVLFRSVETIYGGKALVVVLTGMGQDGLLGAEHLKKQGAYVLAQDRDSSVVWGMPGAVAEAGLANAILPLDEIAQAMQRQVPSQ